MHIKSVKPFWKSLLLVISMTVLNAAAATDASETFRVAGGVAIYLGVVPAEIVKGHAAKHEESKMHDGAPSGRYRNHLVVALFDDATGQRIEDAQVTASVSELGMGLDWNTLEPMRIADTVTYGNYFNMPNTGTYRIHLRIRRPGHAQSIETTFTHGHAEQ